MELQKSLCLSFASVMKAKRDPFQDAFSKKRFVRSLSYREFLTSFSLALFLLACYLLLEYYSGEDWFGSNDSWLRWVIFIIVALFNHIFYRIEHGRSNNFIGRSFHDTIFLLILLPFFQLLSFYNGETVSFSFGNVFTVIMILISGVFIIVSFELLVAGLKRLLRLAGWQIL
jgi:hypothetical protein